MFIYMNMIYYIEHRYNAHVNPYPYPHPHRHRDVGHRPAPLSNRPMIDVPSAIAVRIARPGGPDVLEVVGRPPPQAQAGEIVIAVRAAGINNADVLQRSGRYPSAIARPDVPGLEVAGTVHAVGAGVTGFAVGDAVCALTNGGGYASYCPVPAGQALPAPRGVPLGHAAGLPEGLFTAYSNLYDFARLEAGQSLLVHGGASGVGTLAIQLARALGSRVFATAGTDERCRACVALGADAAINHRTHDFVAEVGRLTDGRGADVILDMVGGAYVMRNVRCLAHGGRIVNIAFQEGAAVDVDFGELMRRDGALIATMLRPKSSQQKARLAQSLRERVWPWVESGAIRPVIAGEFALRDAAAAHRAFEHERPVGKYLLRP